MEELDSLEILTEENGVRQPVNMVRKKSEVRDRKDNNIRAKEGSVLFFLFLECGCPITFSSVVDHHFLFQGV